MTWEDVAKVIVLVWFAAFPVVSFTATNVVKIIGAPRGPVTKHKVVTVVAPSSNPTTPGARSDMN